MVIYVLFAPYLKLKIKIAFLKFTKTLWKIGLWFQINSVQVQIFFVVWSIYWESILGKFGPHRVDHKFWDQIW